MLKRAGFICAVMLSVPALASAWTISARVASGSGNVQNGGVNLLPTPGYVSLSNTLDASKDLTVVPAGGYALGTVLVDGKVATPVSGLDTFRVNFNNTNSHSITAYFNATTIKYTVTSTQTADGSFTLQQTSPTSTVPTTGSLTNVPNGAKIKVTAVPKAGFSVSKITVGGVDYVPQAGYVAGQALVASDIVISGNTSATATYAAIPAVTVSGIAITPTTILNTASATNKPTLTVNAAGNASTGALTYSAVIKKGGVAALLSDNVTPANVTFTGNVGVFGYNKIGYAESGLPAGNDYTAEVTVTGALGGTTTQTVSFQVADAVAASSSSCTGCHTNSTPQIVTAWTAGKHAESAGHDQTTCFRCHNSKGPLYAETNAFTGDATTLYTPQLATPTGTMPGPISCAICHTDGPHDKVFRASAGWNPDGAAGVSEYDLCTSCHVLADTTGKQNHYHTAYSIKNDRIISDTHYDNPATAAGQGNENGTTIINKVEGYVVRMNKDTACADCHDVHAAEAKGATAAGEQTIQQQWARSGHAGKILAQKEAYLKASGTLDATSGIYKTSTAAGITALSDTYSNDAVAQAWTHYDWDNSSGDANDRKACQKCHTATGASNYLTSPSTYVAANNDFSHLSGWATDKKSPQNEVLYCWGCHTSATTGELRNPGAVKADYKTVDGKDVVYPDVQASNVCLACHIGQSAGEKVAALDTATVDFTSTVAPKAGNFAGYNSHYMAAGSIMYVKAGYDFLPANTQVTNMPVVSSSTSPYKGRGNSYGETLTSSADMTVDVNGNAVTGVVTSTHRGLGTSAMSTDSHFEVKDPATGLSYTPKQYNAPANLTVNGPCVTCHYAGGGHELEFNQATLDQVCSKCHSAETGTTVAGLNTFIEEEGVAPFNEAMNLALKVLKDNYNISYDGSAYPYFYDGDASAKVACSDWTRKAFLEGQGKTALTPAQAKNLIGACYNINLLKRDPAAYAHARTYVRRLVYDTIDFLDDLTNNNESVETTALAHDGQTALDGSVFAFKKDTAAYNVVNSSPTTLYGTTTSGMVYLLGWSRSTGAWNAYDRP